MATDSDGAELLVQHGDDRPPTYDGIEPVITPRLRGNLTAVERAWWSGDDLRSKLAQRAFWLTGGEDVAGWSTEDLVGFALQRGVEKTTGHYVTLRKWLTGKVVDLRRKNAVEVVDLYDEDGQLAYDPPGVDFVPSVLPDQVLRWLENHTTPTMYRALTLLSVHGYSQAEAARECGVSPQAVSQALRGLRSLLEEA